MSRRRQSAPEPPAPPAPTDTGGPRLMDKYRELLAKHATLVRKLDERTRLHITTFRLSNWALETSDSALAVMSPSGVVLANTRWHELGRIRGPWKREDGAELRMALRDVGQTEVTALLMLPGSSTRMVRYHQAREARPRVLEVRTERVTGQVEGQVLVLVRDITTQARDEEELAHARATLLEREHVRALGELAAGIAHDLRNTLDAMRLRLQMLTREAPPTTDRGQQHLEALAGIVTDASARVDRLRDFSRKRAGGAREHVQLSEVISDAVDIARGGIERQGRDGGPALRLLVNVPDRLPLVAGSAMELRYVVINLLINARDAMPGGGTLCVRAFRAGRVVRLTVEDEGTGIPEEHLPHLFEPFFTTKGDKGTGLGLAMAHGVVTRAGGTLTAANRPEGGAIFTLSFPALKSPARASRSVPSRPGPPGPGPRRTPRRGKAR
jgi:signal transduction histidine kinase